VSEIPCTPVDNYLYSLNMNYSIYCIYAKYNCFYHISIFLWKITSPHTETTADFRPPGYKCWI